MKRMNKLFLIVAIATLSLTAQAQDKIVTFDQLPKAAQNFVSTYYDINQVSYAALDKEFLSTSYKVKLNTGVEIEFDDKGDWTEVDADHKAVPSQIVPAKILASVKKSFPNIEIVQISKSSRKIEVELANGIDLIFNKKGEFIRVDD